MTGPAHASQIEEQSSGRFSAPPSLAKLKMLTLVGAASYADEMLTMLRELRKAYYAGTKVWGQEGAARAHDRYFSQKYEELMASASDELQALVMDGGPHS